tara:strand:+ start:15661 stop:16716 length:1056 start_codon:yes stop_codon:yes gene_type:complete
MLFKSLSTLLLLLTLISCSPKINSNFTKRYPELQKKDTLKIFELDEYAIRDNSKDELLGFISVRDAGATINCSFDRMLQIVKDSARANGGNIIGIKKHSKPSIFGSSCHQFEADILKLNLHKKDATTLLSEENSSKNNYFLKTKETLKHKFLLNFSVGPSFLIGKRDNSTEFSKAVYDILKTGTQFSFGSVYKYNKRDGVGLKYTYTYRGGTIENASLEFNDFRPTEFGEFKIQTHVNYIGLNFHSGYLFGNDKNEFLLNSSIGYFSYKEISGINTKITTKSEGLGLDLDLGCKRMVSEKFSIGAHFGLFFGNITKLIIKDGISTESITLDREKAINLSNINTGVSISYKL